MNCKTLSRACLVACATAFGAYASEPNLPPFDFSDAFLLANGVNPVGLIARPTGTLPGSVIDETPNGPNFNNVRILEHTAAFDDSGHPIFFYVTGLIFPESFTNDAAGIEARQIADEFKVYEFPRASNAQFAVFPKRQDLIADLSGGYFSNDPLGLWQVNLVRFTPAAFDTQAGQQALAELASRNGLDLDGTPVIKTKSEVEDLESNGFVTIEIPPIGGPDLRWFMCPVIEDPDDGAIALDAHLTIVRQANGSPLAAEQELFDLFHCLQATGDDCNGNGFDGSIAAYGFGTVAACPCGNASGAETGCTNSTGLGARLTGSGSARISNDTVVLSGAQMPNATALYFQGTELASSAFGDGLRVAGGVTTRLGVRTNVNGASSFPSAGSHLSLIGAVPAGSTRYYQVWYRNAAAFCTGATFNLSNGVRISWAQ
jgi:hypothetical protein